MNKYAYATLATTEKYLMGAYCLHHWLKRVKSQYPLIIMVTENIKHLIDDSDEYSYKIIPYHKGKSNYFQDTVNKIFVYSLTSYKKICFLDADIILLENIDFIFTKSNFYACSRKNPDGTVIIAGGIILIEPNQKILNNCIDKGLELFKHDEDIISLYLIPNYYTDFVEDYEIDNLIIKSHYHDGGGYKYFYLFNKIQNIKRIEQLSNEDVIQLLKKIKEIKLFFELSFGKAGMC